MSMSRQDAGGPEDHGARPAKTIIYSPVVLIITASIFGLIGASLGWWKDTRILYRRPGSKWSTDIIPKERIRSSILARRRRKRLLTTAEFGVYGAIFGTLLFWTLQRFAR